MSMLEKERAKELFDGARDVIEVIALGCDRISLEGLDRFRDALIRHGAEAGKEYAIRVYFVIFDDGTEVIVHDIPDDIREVEVKED